MLKFVKFVVVDLLPEKILGGRKYLMRLANFLIIVLKRNVKQVATVREAFLYVFRENSDHMTIFRARLIDWLMHEVIFNILKMFFYFNLNMRVN